MENRSYYFFLEDFSSLALRNVSGNMDIKFFGIYLTSPEVGKTNTGDDQRANLGKTWLISLKPLVHHDVPTHHLLSIFPAFARPLVEYVYLVRHYGLTSAQKDRLERIQYRPLLVVSKSL